MQWTTADVHPAILETALAMNHNRLRRYFFLCIKKGMACDSNKKIKESAKKKMIINKYITQTSERIRNEYDLLKKAGINLNSDLQTIRTQLTTNGLKFVDEDFYPSAQSLYVEGDKSAKVVEEQAMWRRAADFCLKPVIFKDGINPSDVQQGRLGNCWFCCSLASMAERPNLIEKLFVSDQTSKEGCYEVRFCHNGLWKVVLLDDFIPCRPFSGPLYTKTEEDELWVALLEKAYAKIYGCYERLIAGNPYYSLPDLTGCPAHIFDLHNVINSSSSSFPEETNGLWEKLLEWNRTEDNLMSAACDETSKSAPEEAGLMVDHSYTILDAKQGLDPVVRLLCMRNPWGHGEWKGDWSDFSPLWTQVILSFFLSLQTKAKEVFKPSLNPDDGAFWISWEDFLDYFSSITVCYCRRDWVEARIGADLSFDFEKNELTAPLDEREQDAPTNLDLCVFVFRETDGGREPVGFLGMENARHSFESFGSDSRHYPDSLEEGSYLLIPFTSGRHWNSKSGNTRGVALSAHCHSTGSRLGMKIAGALGRAEIDEVYLFIEN
ncbi:hypothetical protein RFI_00758 [Reticulomyxa filosa]|uniref:Calpain catalytic domain-containing protein n=1 Tax=Reticulomyxa filosa TaxID=46433 RepID=X6PF56_RETFI|nr:hypothetical protein RFI_00758 [Reticulomyxa filosa]|eukprot:ETO36307.1 hypothetical protein RFI_00758 [Reticulomyxa filosa]